MLSTILNLLRGTRNIQHVVVAALILGIIEGLALVLLLPALADLGHWLWVFALLAALAAAAMYWQTRRSYDMALDIMRYSFTQLGTQVARLPLGWFRPGLAGKLSRMVSTELMMVGELFAHSLAGLMNKIAATLVLIVGAWLWNPHLGLVFTVGAPALALVSWIAHLVEQAGARKAEPALEELSSRIVEYTHCQAALRSCGRRTYPELAQAGARAHKIAGRRLFYETVSKLLAGSVAQVLIVVAVVVAGRLAVAGELSAVATIAFIGICLRYATIIDGISSDLMAIASRRGVLESIEDVLTARPLTEPAETATLPEPGAIELDHVGFAYNESAPVLHDVSFHVPAGSMCALVGPSGCGKTTIARLISRFYDTTSGVVRIGGADVKEQTTEALMAQLSMVFQDVYLFDDTLITNIKVGNEHATDEQVYHAAELAGVTEIANRLGWDTPVGEGGKRLSGGERQRVAVARALLKQAPIVLLDEATSALDPENEANIVRSVEQLRTHATLLVIAHKLDTIAHADMIVALTADGRVEDVGTHDELLARGGTYARFIAARANAAGWQLNYS